MYNRTQYNLNNWYWIVAGDETRVYSSAQQAYVSAEDEAYSAWCVQGNNPTRILNAEELFDVLKQSVVNELAALDASIPRGLEDMWEAQAFDTTLLPQVQQDRLAQKQALRDQIESIRGSIQ